MGLSKGEVKFIKGLKRDADEKSERDRKESLSFNRFVSSYLFVSGAVSMLVYLFTILSGIKLCLTLKHIIGLTIINLIISMQVVEEVED